MNKICSFKQKDNIINIIYFKNININDWEKYINQLSKISFNKSIKKKIWIVDCRELSFLNINLIYKKLNFLKKNQSSIDKHIEKTILIINKNIMNYVSYILPYIPNSDKISFVTSFNKSINN